MTSYWESAATEEPDASSWVWTTQCSSHDRTLFGRPCAGGGSSLDTGKTLMVKTLARLIQGEFKRLQFTPDLMPSDIVGTSVFDLATNEFRVRTGPIFANIVLTDEINRAPPKTQSALLEAMEERQVTIDGVSHPLPEPFMVAATQNPLGYEDVSVPRGTAGPLPVQGSRGLPIAEDEEEVLSRHRSGRSPERSPRSSRRLLTPEGVISGRKSAEKVRVDDSVISYATAIARAPRQSPDLHLGEAPGLLSRLSAEHA